jgi:predicted DNA-binding transcriptional regulator AlpA
METTERRLKIVVRKKELPKYVGIGLNQIDEMIVRGDFPPGRLVNEGGLARVWFEDELIEWQAKLHAKEPTPAPWLAKRMREKARGK